jgi:chaperonin GroES
VLTGKVIAIGPGKKDEPMVVKVGDNISYSDNAGTPLNIEEVDYLLMRQAAIYGIL